MQNKYIYKLIGLISFNNITSINGLKLINTFYKLIKYQR